MPNPLHGKKRKCRAAKLFCTDKLVRNIHSSLLDDLQPFQRNWFVSPRKYVGPIYENWTAYDFKKMTQLENFFKRVILLDDVPSEVIELLSIDDFVKSQDTFGIRRRTQRSTLVMQRAREIVHEILGDFSYEKFFRYCKFGKRSAVGLPRRESYLDNRIKSLNGSREQYEWFKACMAQDIHLHRACRRVLKKATQAYVISMKAVPKTWKAARLVFPDTTIGGFLSAGLGSYLQYQLCSGTHIDITLAQNLHQEEARKASITGKRATIDMKRASDSFVWEHVETLCPESWLPAFRVCWTELAELPLSDKPIIKLRSAMLMGSGHTFPAQTIFWYAMCKATCELLGSKARVDVYGDDIIVPSAYASYIVDVFDDLGFTVNESKSFATGPFRESCGGDFHSGVDVRPYMPELVCGKLQKNPYTEVLHTIYNGLLERWDPCEIPLTLDLILIEILRVQGNLCPIPKDYPETSGLKYIPVKFSGAVKKPIFENGLLHFFVLRNKPKRRSPSAERIYYWYWLRKKGIVEKRNPYGDEEETGMLDKNGQEPVKGSHRLCWVTTRK